MDFKPIKALNKTYVVDKIPLAKGAFGVVRRAKLKNNGSWAFAVKEINTERAADDIDFRNIDKEIYIQAQMDHPHILKIIDAFKGDETVSILCTLAFGGTLIDYLEEPTTRMNESFIRTVLLQLLDALSYMKDKGVVHRDIKAENILLQNDQDREQILLADFGLATEMGEGLTEHSLLSGKQGTEEYMAPEILLFDSVRRPYNYKVDIWATGVLIYVLLNNGNRYPFGLHREPDFLRKAIHAQIEFPEGEWWESKNGMAAKTLMSKMMAVDINIRYGYDQVLNDKWLLNKLSPE